VLFRERVLVSKKKDALAAMNRCVAVDPPRLRLGFERFVFRWKRKVFELAHVSVFR
jgi:hypothetical protein